MPKEMWHAYQSTKNYGEHPRILALSMLYLYHAFCYCCLCQVDIKGLSC